MSNSGRWKPSSEAEQERLSPKESDWRLSGIETQGLGRTRSKSRSPTPSENVPLSVSVPTAAAAMTSEASVHSPKDSKPANSRALIEVNPMLAMMTRHLLPCPMCKSELEMSLATCCVMSHPKVTCTNGGCQCRATSKPQLTNIELPDSAGSPLIERNTDCAANVLCFLAFLASGDGGAEAARLLGLLGLPSGTTMETRSFKSTEDVVGPQLRNVADAVAQENPQEEKKLPAAAWPKIAAATDVGWQKRSSGRRCDSHSGHALMVGTLTRKPVAWCVCQKVCSFCKRHNTRHDVDEPPPEHPCVQNHEGSSGSMEPLAALEMFKHLHTSEQTVITPTVTDDNSSVKAKLKWSNGDCMTNMNTIECPQIINGKGNLVPRPNHGRLPPHMPEPTFLADPNHRKKTLKGMLCKLAGKRKAERLTMTKVDCVRISTNCDCFIRALPLKPREEWEGLSTAVLDHHFDCHDKCGDWCLRKQQSIEEKKVSLKHCRSVEKDKELHFESKGTMERFVTTVGLDEVGHGLDTQVNESLSNSIAWLAPKNTHCSSTQSLRNRIAVAIAINGLGICGFHERTFDALGISMADDMKHHMQWTSSRRAKRTNRAALPVNKKKRQKRFHDKLKEHTETAKKERFNREGCEPGVGLEGAEAVRKKKPKTPNVCPLPVCLLKGHKTSRSLKCKCNPKNEDCVGIEEASKCANEKPAAVRKRATEQSIPAGEKPPVPDTAANTTTQAERDAAEQDIVDAVPLNDEFCSAEEFSESTNSVSAMSVVEQDDASAAASAAGLDSDEEDVDMD